MEGLHIAHESGFILISLKYGLGHKRGGALKCSRNSGDKVEIGEWVQFSVTEFIERCT